MAILKFNLDDVRNLVKATLGRGTGYRLNGNQTFDPAFAKPGVVLGAYGLNSDQIDTSKIPPALWLVHDDGVYLLSNSIGCELVVYAEGLGVDEYEEARSAVGGDDFCDALPLDDVLKKAIFAEDLKPFLFIDFRADSLKLYVTKKPRRVKP